MSVQDLINAMPKVELHVHLDGAMHKERLMVIAEQNEIAAEQKKFGDWVQMLDAPDYDNLHELGEITSGWLQHPDDLAHVTYELGVSLAKQNVRYAEVVVNPMYFIDNNWSFEQFLRAINDGRDRAERGWNVRMRWVLTTRRDQPRHSDEMVRLASGSAGQAGGIVGVDLSGPEDAQPVGQFERAYRTADRKQIFTSAHAGERLGVEGVLDVLNVLQPDRLNTGWGAAESPEALQQLAEKQIPLVVSIAEAVARGWIKSAADYPLRKLMEADIPVILSSDRPAYYNKSLNDEYLLAVEACGLSMDELEILALNAVHASRLPDDEKAALEAEFNAAYDEARAGNISEEETASS